MIPISTIFKMSPKWVWKMDLKTKEVKPKFSFRNPFPEVIGIYS